ncbi:MAG: hypothetical protein AB7U82_14910 [Blastocatellales bacterium]
MKYLALLILLFLPVAAAQNGAEKKSDRPVFKGLLQKYKGFRDIQPTLEISSDKSVFLSSFYPQAAAQLLRYNDRMKKWEAGEWARYCATVDGVTKPIEIKPGESFRPNVYWRLSMNNWDKPTAFITTDGKNRPLRGKYKLTIQYAGEPWVLGNFPKLRYFADSEEFFIEP